MNNHEIESWVAIVAGHLKPAALMSIDAQSWLAEVEQNEVFLAKLGSRLPSTLRKEHELLRERLRTSIS